MGQLHHLSMSHIGRQRINGVPGLLFHSYSCHPNPDLCPPLPLTKEGLKLRPVAQSMVTEMYISQCQAMAMTKGSIGTSWDELVAAANATELTAIKALGLAQAGHLHFLDRKHVDSLDIIKREMKKEQTENWNRRPSARPIQVWTMPFQVNGTNKSSTR